MTGPEHYAEAERLLAEFDAIEQHGLYTITPTLLTRAQLHMGLAQAAATALAGQGEGNMLLPDDRAAWIRAASESPKAAQRRREADAAEAAEFSKS
jgi:hypothetical protein